LEDSEATLFPFFRSYFSDWTVANFLDDTSLGDGQFGYQMIEIDPLAIAARHRSYPVEERASVRQFGTDYVVLEGEGDLTVRFEGTQVVSLTGNEVRDGTYQWWSNRGDDADVTLTRAFDLTGLDQATLNAWMWYDLEDDYDYAYVAVSANRGRSWDLLSNEHTTSLDPSGNSYGPALTGQSGSGEEPAWVLHSFDLTPYTGREVLVRFEVITDEALNYPGLCIDEISIPELGYVHDPDEGSGEWDAAGWIRVTDHIPQTFVLQVITEGRETKVQRIDVDADGQAEFDIQGLGWEVDRAILVISGSSPFTTEPAIYSYSIGRSD
jgi:hypothetical protein